RFQHIVTAGIHQAATDKGKLRQAEVNQQLPHTVAKENLGCAVHKVVTAAPDHLQAVLFTQPGRTVESFRVTWHQYQKRIRHSLPDQAKRLQYFLIFAFTGAGGNPYGSITLNTRLHILYTLRQIFRQGDIELDAAGY